MSIMRLLFFACCFFIGLLVVDGHVVVGTIENESFLTLTLTKSQVHHGTIISLPAVQLGPFSSTNFSFSSSVTFDEIRYDFGYTPTSVWCETINPPLQINGEFEYKFGSNSCHGESQQCYNATTFDLSYYHCGSAVADSKPLYVITLTNPPSPSPPPTPTPSLPPTPVPPPLEAPRAQTTDCGVGGTQVSYLDSVFPPFAFPGQSFVVQIGGDGNSPGTADGSSISKQEWYFSLPATVTAVSDPVVDNVGKQGQVLSGGGTLEPFAVSLKEGVITLSGQGKVNNGAVFVPPGFNITVVSNAASGTVISFTMNDSPTYTCHAVISVKCTAISPLVKLTNTTLE